MSKKMIEIRLPEPPSSPRPGSLDAFIGPGATAAEIILQFVPAFLIGYLCFQIYQFEQQQQQKEQHDDPSTLLDGDILPADWNSIIALLLGIDMIGGVITNSTSAAKRWYHRTGQGFVDHMIFISIHAMQIATVAFLFVDVDENDTDKFGQQKQWVYFGLVYGTVMISSMIVLSVPLYLQRPTAMTFVAASIPLSMSSILPKSTGLEWFVPLLFLKLLVAHLTIEMPFEAGSIIVTEESRQEKKKKKQEKKKKK